jgi:hypothetical protein
MTQFCRDSVIGFVRRGLQMTHQIPGYISYYCGQGTRGRHSNLLFHLTQTKTARFNSNQSLGPDLSLKMAGETTTTTPARTLKYIDVWPLRCLSGI